MRDDERIAKLFRYAQVGMCVNSVSHDVNNLLGVILAYSELLSVDPSISVESQRMLREIISAVRKATLLVGALTDIARKERTDIRIIDPAQLAERALSLLQYTIRTQGVNIERNFQGDLGTVAVDLPKITLALVYLLMNALDSIQAVEHKLLRMSVCKNGDSVEFAIWDSGEPIPTELHQKIFEPYFTTKSELHFGLGLSLAQTIVQEHDGCIFYQPERGFVILLPYHNRHLNRA